MTPVPPFPQPRGRAAGFSLVEVTLALGIMAFCMIAILGLLPVGMNSLQNGQDESRASAALNLAATSVHSAQFVSRDSGGLSTYKFPLFFSDDATTPKTFTVKGSEQKFTFFVLEDGSIRKTPKPGDPTPPPTPRQTMFVQVFPPASDAEPLRVYAAVAWPWKGSDLPTSVATDLKGRQGLVDSLIVYAPRNN